MPSRLDIAKPDIVKAFDQRGAEGKHVFSTGELAQLLSLQRSFWRVAQRTTVTAFVEFLREKAHLEEVVLSSEVLRSITRYVWRQASPYEIALSLRPLSYLSHGSAVFLHGLNDQIPSVIYVNQEQTPKPAPSGPLTQDGLDRAFANSQRVSQGVYQLGDKRIVVLSGKWTDSLGVVPLKTQDTTVRVTDIDRTLVDIVVRPTYAGGPQQVLEAYRGALDRASANVLVSYLKKLDYRYPYAQAIGYYMTLAGYPESRLTRLREMMTGLNFYLTHGLRTPDYDPSWRVFIPKGFVRPA